MTAAVLAMAGGCVLNPCSPGVQINPPPINSSSGMVLAGLVILVVLRLALGGGKKK